MKKTLLYSSLIVLASCNCSAPSGNDTRASAEVMQTDKDFNDYCAKNGQAAAFIKYADSSLIESGQGSLPVRGIEQLKASLNKNDLGNKLSWVPEKTEASGNIGYSFGWWEYATKTKVGNDTVYHGDYVTVWKKQKDGTWKYVFDGGNDTPDPKK